MKYTEMSNKELIKEMIRVKELMLTNHKPHTYHQNKKYLEKLEKEYKKRHGED